MSFHNSSRSDPAPLKSGLTKELDKLGRTRGSSATPVPVDIVSPTPQKGFQKQIAGMNAFAGASGGDGQGLSPASNRSVSTSIGIHSQIHDQGQQSSERDRGESSLSLKSIDDFSAQLQTRLIELKQDIIDAPGLPSKAQEDLSTKINNISQDFTQLALENAQNGQIHIQSQLDQAEARVLAANFDRDQAYTKILEIELKKQKSIDRLNQVAEALKKTNNNLLKQIEFQEDELKGKRASWMDKNPGSSARRSAINAAIRDPFSSPLANMGSGGLKGKGRKGDFAGGMMGSFGSPGVSTSGSIAGSTTNSVKRGSFGKSNPPSGDSSFNTSLNASFENKYSPLAHQSPFVAGNSPPVNPTPVAGRLRRRGALPTSNPMQFAEGQFPQTKQAIMDSLNSLPKNTEPGSPERYTRALVLRPKDSVNVSADVDVDVNGDEFGLKYEAAFTELYELAEDWCKQYASIPNPEVDQAIATSNETLWAYMMNCTYPGQRQDAHAHVTTLLQDPKCRYLFTLRMVVNYCIRDIVAVEEFESFSPETEIILTQCKNALLARGLANEVRQSIIDRQTKTVKDITKLENYANFRISRLNHHTAQLRDMLGPLLNNHISRADAGKDLGRLATKAFDTCAYLHTSSLTFQVYFPETSTRFNAATMIAKDQVGTDPLQLQVAQIRLKLVVTPVVTMRDDRGPTIRAKNLHKAQVLTMV